MFAPTGIFDDATLSSSATVECVSRTRPIDALIFDFDGVIIDTESTFHRVWTAVFEEFGCRFSRSEWQSLIGTSGVADPYTWLEQRATRALPKQEEIRSIVQSREKVEVDLLGPMPGVLDWLDAARDADVPIAVASSSSRPWVQGRLAQLGILDLFAAVVCRNEHLRAKPAPDVYLAACGELGADPNRSVAIEDSRNGVSSAVAAGLTCIAVPNEITADMDLSGAHHLMSSLEEASLTQVLEVIGERRRMLDRPST